MSTTNRTTGIVQVVECLPTKREALRSNTNTTKKKKNRRKCAKRIKTLTYYQCISDFQKVNIHRVRLIYSFLKVLSSVLNCFLHRK
jgi:hypothetical protein